MYIIKNALKSVTRSKVRNILIIIITLVIAISACVSLSIKEAAVDAKNETLDGMSVTAEISYDRSSQLSEMKGSSDSEDFDASSLSRESTALTLDEYLEYAELLGDDDTYYYSMTTSLNADDSILPYGTESSDDSDDTEEETTTTEDSNAPDGMGGGGKGAMFESQGDFVVEGFSSDDAMISMFGEDGTYTISDGSVFEEGTDEMVCIISDELAEWNDGIAVGDTISLVNPSNEDETYELEVVGIYTNSASSSSETSFMSSTDSANYVYVSYNTLSAIVAESEENAVTTTDDSGNEKESTLTTELTFTYSFNDAEDYYAFEEDVYDAGLSDEYIVSSSDISSFENSLVPLENLSTMAGWFLLVVFLVGAIILFVLNVFNIRERKYEIGVLTAIGMKKSKVAVQFVMEMLCVTLVAIVLGAAIGTGVSVPVTNALLANQIESTSSSQTTVDSSFGRGANAGGGSGMSAPGSDSSSSSSSDSNSSDSSTSSDSKPSGGGNGMFGNISSSTTEYVSSVSNATDLKVVGQLMLVGILLSLISSSVSVITIMRYEPLKILANRN